MINLRSRSSILRYHAWFERQMNILERKNTKLINNVLVDQFKDASDYLLHGIGLESINDAITFNTKDLENAYKTIYEQSTKVFHSKVLNELKSVFNIEKKVSEEEYWYNINKWIKKNTAKNVEQVNDNTKRVLKRIIKKGMDEGKSNSEISVEILELSSISTILRAERITRTETHSAAVNAINDTMIDSGMGLTKSWSSAMDERTRDDHGDADRRYSENPIDLEEPFSVGDEYLEFPGDPNGSPGNIINCRCVVLYFTKNTIA
jgi:uncharacterized protein with gpF-like domain